MWIAQISDPHLRPEGVFYNGVVDPAAALALAVQQINRLTPRPDLVLLTGDVAETGTAEEYALARKLLGRLEMPCLAIPGNHDLREPFRDAFAGTPRQGPLHDAAGQFGAVRVVALDVTVPGQHHGEADAASLAWLRATLAEEPGRPTVVMLHQPPIDSGIPYLDAYNCRGAGALESVIRDFPCVERVLCGHVHRTMLQRFAGTLLCTAPSLGTAIALRPYPEAEAASYLEPPGFLLHHWDGKTMLTHAVPLGVFPGPYGFA
ncbi:phosphodiesterase [Pseudoroseomonas deserti]|uniref:Phosphodiesterase n=1 Tax=Teichococcus deserti TaxID=1817963 RepID=A0A1V2GUM1_9PROT|nr:phosphodiesterase [Pseudoroseomonas deserti]ONG45574.1 phosphodiesterase [Pseudoroseomonas deserti]